MNNEEKIITMLAQMRADIAGLKDGPSQMQADIASLKDG